MYIKPKPSLLLRGLESGAGALFFCSFVMCYNQLGEIQRHFFSLGITVDMAYVVFHFQVNLVALRSHDNQPKHHVMTLYLSLMVHVSIEMKWSLP